MPDSDAVSAQLELCGPLPSRLEVLDLDDHRAVLVNGHLIARYECADRGTERVVVTQLAEVLSLEDQQIAAVFGLHPVTLSRLRSQAREGGAAALMPRKTGPRGPSKMTPQLAARCRQLRQQELSYRTIAEQVSRRGRKISYRTVAALFQNEAAAAVPQPLPLEMPPAAEESAAPAATAFAESRPSRYAGAFLLYAALGRLDVWGVLRQLGAAVGRARHCGWTQLVATIIFCFALRFRSLEDSKNARRRDLGVLIGESQVPPVAGLRRKVQALVESVDPVALSRELFHRYLKLEPVWEGLYYLDGHFCPYYGKHPTPKGWDPQRRLAAKGHTDVYLHDARGRALFFLSQPLNDSLARAIPRMVEEIRRVHGPEPFTLVFDRGGYSGDAFRFLRDKGIGFITYLKGRQARRQYPMARFRPGWFPFEGRRRVYRLWEKRTRIAKAGAIRTILFLGEDGHQIPVLTSLDRSARAAKVVHCLRLRWRQENSFKYLIEHYAIDQIIQYGAEQEQNPRLVPNPRRKALPEKIREASQQIQRLEAQLGRALDGNDETRRATARGLKIAHATVRRDLAQRRQVLARLENRLRHTPSQIAAAAVDKTRFLLREDRRLLVNALKLLAYNAEKLLAHRFHQYYQQPKDVLSIFRGVLQLPGEVHPLASDRLEVRLARPHSDKVAQALEGLLRDLNLEHPRLLGDGPILSFTLSELT
jgi:hypothetical protein